MAIKKRKPATVPARSRVKLEPGDVVRVVRELQEMSQADLAKASGLTQPTISSIESKRIAIGVDRAAKLAIALKVHPSVILFPHWAEEHPVAAAG